MLEILGRANSINVRKVLWICDELELEWTREDWGIGFRSPSVPDFVRLNPNALVPVIRDGSFVLWESHAILRYLARKHEAFDLLPQDAEKQAIVDQWMGWASTELNKAWRGVFLGLMRRTPGFDRPEQIEAATVDPGGESQSAAFFHSRFRGCRTTHRAKRRRAGRCPGRRHELTSCLSDPLWFFGIGHVGFLP